MKLHAVLTATLFLFASIVLADERVDLKLDTTEADAVLSILARNAAGKAIGEDDWARLFTSTPYVRLKKREASMRRDFTDEEFKRFVLSADTVGKAAALGRTLQAWRGADLNAAARRALAYLPAAARIRVSVYPCIKPRPNSFVWETTSDPAIFLYLDPAVPDRQFENTVAHELHHIGLASLDEQYTKRIEALPPNARKAATWMGALGEGWAMLAAAGSPDVDPVAAFPRDDQTRWRQDVSNWDEAVRQLDQFFADIVEGGFSRPDVADHVAMTFFGYRGPWYQAGYEMAITIEKELGRRALIETMSDPRSFVSRYNEAATRINARGKERLPLFRQSVLDAVASAIKHPAP